MPINLKILEKVKVMRYNIFFFKGELYFLHQKTDVLRVKSLCFREKKKEICRILPLKRAKRKNIVHLKI